MRCPITFTVLRHHVSRLWRRTSARPRRGFNNHSKWLTERMAWMFQCNETCRAEHSVVRRLSLRSLDMRDGVQRRNVREKLTVGHRTHESFIDFTSRSSVMNRLHLTIVVYRKRCQSKDLECDISCSLAHSVRRWVEAAPQPTDSSTVKSIAVDIFLWQCTQTYDPQPMDARTSYSAWFCTGSSPKG